MRHPYHLVDVSPWPIIMSGAVLTGAMGLVSWLTHYPFSNIYLILPTILLVAFLWWRDVIREGSSFHTKKVVAGINIGYLLFLLSEVMLFFSFIWGYLHASLSPAVELGSVWPPVGIESLNPWTLPLVGTCLLLSSGFTVTLSHHAIVAGARRSSLISLFITIILGLAFVVLQASEYYFAPYQIADSVFGTVFYSLTGLHGLHVIAGVTFLFVCFCRMYSYQLTKNHHVGFVFAIYYWHLVDVVWILVYALAYIWGANCSYKGYS